MGRDFRTLPEMESREEIEMKAENQDTMQAEL